MQRSYSLGLDLGSNSAGWAVVFDEPQPDSENLILGVRVFPEGTEHTKSGEEPRNLKRRQARSARRLLDRRSRRKRHLRGLFKRAGALPQNPAELAQLLQLDPYELRARALSEPLPPAHFARTVIHLGQRRGFKSNLKTQGDQAKEEEGIKANISDLAATIEKEGARTLGEYLWRLKQNYDLERKPEFATAQIPECLRIRNRHTARQMYIDEFNLIWSAQAGFHPELWTDSLREAIYQTIFFQRPLKPQNHLIGKCELEPDQPRAAKASWYAQQARMLQEVNNFRILTRGRGERSLTPPERQDVLEKLSSQISPVKIDILRNRILKLADVESLNFESSARDKIEGNWIEANLRRIFRNDYDKRADWIRDTVWEALIHEDAEPFREKALNAWKLTPEQVDGLFKIRRPDGYAAYSLVALKKLLPHLENGLSVHDARIAAEYQPPAPEKTDHLPPVRPGDIRNPVVTRALSETRKVVNALIRQYGMPARITVELARETKGTIKSRQQRDREMRDRERRNKNIAQELEKMGVSPNRLNIEKYLLWEECQQVCPYSGISIGLHELFGDANRFQVEHILPYSLSFDDSFLNKTLCEVGINREKGNRTPWEAFHGDSARYENILTRVQRNANMPYEKQRRFSMREISDDFTQRQLQDTSYIATFVTNYLKRLDGAKVRTTRGPITAELRHQWGLNSLLGADGKKNRADHRHHAVDALAIALTTPAYVQALAHTYDFDGKKKFPSPWADAAIDPGLFRTHAEAALRAVRVSHRPQRRVQGQLTEETNYGPTAQAGVFSCRVPLSALTTSAVETIADGKVRQIVIDRLRAHDVDVSGGTKAIPAAVFKEPLYMHRRDGGRGPVIKTVRVRRPIGGAIAVHDENGKAYRYLKPGSNHHIAIYEYKDEKGRIRRCKDMVSRYEAMQRLRRGEPVVRKTHPDFPQARFLMSLSINDMVWVKNGDGDSGTLCRVQKISGGDRQEGMDISFRHHTASTIDDKETEIRITSLAENKFHVKKVQIGILGEVHPAHD